MPTSAPAPYIGYVLPDQQRAVLVRVAALEAQNAQLFGQRMLAIYDQTLLWEQAPGPEAFGIVELAGTVRIGQSRAATAQSDARRLVEVLRGTLEGLQAGTIYQPAAELLLRLTRNCTDDVAAEVERRVLPHLGGNTTELRRMLPDVILQVEVDLDPDGLAERERLARERRGVWIRPTEDGMCQVGADLDDLTGRRWCLDFEELVRAQKVADDAAGIKRTRNQRRADVFASMPGQLLALLRAIVSGDLSVLQGLAQQDADSAEDLAVLAEEVRDLLDPEEPEPATEPVPVSDKDLIRALLRLTVRDPRVLNVHIPMTTLLDLDNRCGWLEGIGPISPHRARWMLPAADLRRVVTDPRSGIPQHLDKNTIPPPDPYDPDDPEQTDLAAEQVRQRLLAMLTPTVITESAGNAHDPPHAVGELVDVRDRMCTGIGCSLPASRCDRDHEDPYPDGPTAVWNLSDKSKRCHRAKHAGWTVTRDEGTGLSTWRSPLGHTYVTRGVWRPQPPVPPDAVLPPPRLPREPQVEPEDDSSWNQPLSLPERAPRKAPTQRPTTTPPRATWDDEPPF